MALKLAITLAALAAPASLLRSAENNVSAQVGCKRAKKNVPCGESGFFGSFRGGEASSSSAFRRDGWSSRGRTTTSLVCIRSRSLDNLNFEISNVDRLRCRSSSASSSRIGSSRRGGLLLLLSRLAVSGSFGSRMSVAFRVESFETFASKA